MTSCQGQTLFHLSLKWARKNLFSSPLNSVLTLACAGLVIMIGVPLVNWLFVNAYWSGATPADCPDKSRRLLAVYPGAL